MSKGTLSTANIKGKTYFNSFANDEFPVVEQVSDTKQIGHGDGYVSDGIVPETSKIDELKLMGNTVQNLVPSEPTPTEVFTQEETTKFVQTSSDTNIKMGSGELKQAIVEGNTYKNLANKLTNATSVVEANHSVQSIYNGTFDDAEGLQHILNEAPFNSAELEGITLVNEAVINEIEADNYYGVYFNTANSSVGVRTGLAVGLNAASGVDAEVVTNDFDSIYPWSDMKLCNLADNGTVNAYEGDATFTRDGSNGQVMVEIPKFYQYRVNTETGTEYRISKDKLTGYWLNPCFIDSATGTELDKVYISAYKASNTSDVQILESRSGVHPTVNITMTEARTKAKNRGAGWQLEDVCIRSLLEYLIFIEYADLDTQSSIAQGQVNFTAKNTTKSSTNETKFVVANADASQYVAGQTVIINGDLCLVTGKEADDADNTAILIDSQVTVSAGQSIDMRAWKCGSCDNVVAKTGSIVSKTDGKHPFKYRGIENLWGDIWEFVDGISIQANKPYVCTDPSKYVDEATEGTDGYSYVGYDTCTSNGTIKRMGLGLEHPYVALPIAVGGNYPNYSDYYYQNNETNRICLAGGFWRDGGSAGLSYWFCNNACTNRWSNICGRLAYKIQIPSTESSSESNINTAEEEQESNEI